MIFDQEMYDLSQINSKNSCNFIFENNMYEPLQEGVLQSLSEGLINFIKKIIEVIKTAFNKITELFINIGNFIRDKIIKRLKENTILSESSRDDFEYEGYGYNIVGVLDFELKIPPHEFLDTIENKLNAYIDDMGKNDNDKTKQLEIINNFKANGYDDTEKCMKWMVFGRNPNNDHNQFKYPDLINHLQEKAGKIYNDKRTIKGSSRITLERVEAFCNDSKNFREYKKIVNDMTASLRSSISFLETLKKDYNTSNPDAKKGDFKGLNLALSVIRSSSASSNHIVNGIFNLTREIMSEYTSFLKAYARVNY